jgi:nucleoside-diphosphate-sugar epimerase
MSLHVVLGKGPVGSALARELHDRGADVRVLSRSGGAPAGGALAGVDHRAVEASDPAALATASAGAEVIYNCANPAYTRWVQDWPPVAAALLVAAERTGAVLVTVSNLYGYGEVDGPLTEDLPLAAVGTKGQVRARMWEQALAAHRAGRVRVTEARASDFVGPGVVDGGQLGRRVVPRVLAGRGVRVLGDPDAPHSWTYVPDVARTLARLGGDAAAWGRAWHVPSPAPLSQREAVVALCRAAGVDPVPVGRLLPGPLLPLVGLAVPQVRELREVLHQFRRPFVLDSSAATAAFGLTATPADEVFAATVAWWRGRERTAVAA